MYLQRSAWRDVTQLLAANADALPASYWWEFMRDTYSTTQAVAIRRQADKIKGVATLGRLLQELSESPARVTRDYFFRVRNTYDPHRMTEAARCWVDHYGGEQ